MGRPTKYTYDYCLKEILLFKDRLFSDGEAEAGLKYFTWHDLIKDRPYSRQRISEWREKFKDKAKFSDTIKKIDEELENRLFKFALINKVNPTMAIFSLKNNFGWKDKTETELTGKDGKDLGAPLFVFQDISGKVVEK
jgi:hypothetical protein